MKLVIEYKEMDRISKVMSLMSNDKDTAINFITGIEQRGEQVLNQFRITTAYDQLEGMFLGSINGDEVNTSFAVNAVMFTNLLASLLSYKEEVYMELTENMFFVGVGDKSRIPLPFVSESMEPVRINEAEIAFQLSIESKDFEELSQKSFYFVSDSTDGFNSAILCFNMVKGEVKGYSSDGYGIATSSIPMTTLRQCINPESPMAEAMTVAADTMDAVLEKYCAIESGMSKENYGIALPVKAVQNMRTLSSFGKTLGLSGDEHHLFVMSGDENTIYTCTKAAGFNRMILNVDNMIPKSPSVKVMVDTAQLKQGFRLIKKVIDLNKFEHTPVRMKVTEQNIELCVRQMTEGSIKIPILGQEGAGMHPDMVWYMSTDKALLPINALSQGNALLYLTAEQRSAVIFGNGDLTEGLSTSVAVVLPTAPDTNTSDTEKK